MDMLPRFTSPSTPTATTLGGVMAQVREHLSNASSNRLVVEVRLDGRTLPADELEQHHDAPLDVTEVQLITAEPVELARQTMLDVADALAAARDDQQRAAELLRDDDMPAALEHVRSALTVWGQAQQSVLHSAQLLGLSLDAVKLGDQTVPEMVEHLSELLRLVRDQLQAGDLVGLADTLEYELTDQTQLWSDLIKLVTDQVRRDGN
jgi:hypothetical protein